jgi:F-type H+-transporting ATPase subunit delta
MTATKRSRQAARRLYRLCLVQGRLAPLRVRFVAHHISKSSRRGGLALLQEFQRLVRLDRDRHTALVESAVPLTGELRRTIRDRLDAAYGPGLDTSFQPNPKLIGGLRIRVGSDVFDGSVRGRLAALEARL